MVVSLLVLSLIPGCLQLDTSGPGQQGGDLPDAETSSSSTSGSASTVGSSPATSGVPEPEPQTSSSSDEPDSTSTTTSGRSEESSSSGLGPPDAWVPFSNITPLDEVNTGADERSPSMTADELYIALIRENNVFASTRSTHSGNWSALVALPGTGVPLGGSRSSARIDAEGDELIFSWRTGGNLDLHRIHVPPLAVAIGSTTSNDEYFLPDPSLTRAVYASDSGGNFDLYEVQRPALNAAWGAPSPLDAANGPGRETSPCLGGNGTLLLFVSDSHSVGGDLDIYRMSHGEGGVPVPVDELNLPGVNEADIWISPDLSSVMFTRENEDGRGDIYVATR